MKKTLSLLFLFISILSPSIRADEGMWIPMLIERYNIKLMQEKGFKLSAEDIYSINKACMKDAVLIFGGGCTGEIISGEGLVITNHHCGYGMIQRHSSLDHNYLKDGFWAMNHNEELSNPGLTVTILRRMEDVTADVLKGVTDEMSQAERDKLVNSNIYTIEQNASQGTGYSASVKPFYMGNQYFLFLNETFRDIRLVGAPPESIGKFGGETDNWIWPRHTGDFSLFRIYADKNNKPSDYSKDNVPYKPPFFFPVSLKGVKEGDFTMVFGYPGSTEEYVPSYHIEMVKNYIDPKIIDIRTKKIEIMEAAMNTDPLIRIQYSARKSGLANSWKKWQGEILGLDRMNTIAKKQEFETSFTSWVNSDAGRKAKYGDLLPAYRTLYDSLKVYMLINSYTTEVFGGAESITLAGRLRRLIDLELSNGSPENINVEKQNLISSAKSFFKDYNKETDKKLFIAVMETYGKNIDPAWLVPEYVAFRNSCKGNFQDAADKLYDKSPFTDEKRFSALIGSLNRKTASRTAKDELYLLSKDASELLNNRVRDVLFRLNGRLRVLNRLYMAAQMEYQKDRLFYPDANFTLRVTYGQVMGYKPKDAVYYTCYSTLSGIMEKDNPEIFDYDVPEKLRELYRNKDFGRYAVNGDVPVCFIANNHTSGGNSGSPVINGDGQLIGVNFDRAWEGVASDMAYNPDQSRNISLDIRFALFIIDKFAGAGYLLKEMNIVE